MYHIKHGRNWSAYLKDDYTKYSIECCHFDRYRNDPKFWTNRSGQTVQTQIRLLLKEQSDQGLHCFTAGNLDNRSHWLCIINLMEHFRVTCGSEVVSCQHSLQSESGR